MRQLITYFIKYPITGNVIMFMAFLFGALGLFNLQSTFFPEVESRIISIQVVYPGASPEEVEEGITIKIEDNLKGTSGIERITSVSQENTASITVEVLRGYDTDLVLQDVKNAVDRISSFPVGMEPPVVYKRETLSFVINFALSGDVELKVLKKFARKVENDLRGNPELSKVELSGFPEEEIEISFRENALRAYNLTFEEASNSIRRSNLEITGGSIKSNDEELLIRANAKKYYGREIADLVLKANDDGSIIRLRDVAEIRDQWAEGDPNRSYLNGKPAVLINVQSTMEEDLLTIAEYVRNYVEKFNAENQAIKATIVQDFSTTLQDRIDLLIENGIVGGILVLIFLSLFLNIYLAFWVAIGIPISFCGMFVIAAFYGITINVISLFGMIIVIGILVDDGIVISENIYQHYERGKTPLRAAIDGTMEVIPAVFTAVFTTAIAFSSFFFIDGRPGDFFSQMAFVVIATLLFSLIEGFLILPAHVSHSNAMKNREKKLNWLEKQMENFLYWMRDRVYAPVLKFSLEHKVLALAVFTALFIITIGAIRGKIISTTFFPNIERDNISINLALPAGTREHVTEKWLNHIQKGVAEVNESYRDLHGGNLVIVNVNKKVGPQSHQGNISLSLLSGEARKVKAFEISNKIREAVGAIPNAEELSYGTEAAFGKPISVSLLGYNKQDLEAVKEALKTELKKNTDIKDIVDSDREGLREVNISLKEKAYLLGLKLQDVLGQVRQGFFGSEAQRLQRSIDEVKVWVRYEQSDRASVEDLEEMRIRLSDGRAFPLHELANVSIERGIIAINHLDSKREVKIEADVANPEASVTDLVFEIQNDIMPKILKRYPSVETSYEGQSREAAKVGRSAATTMPVILSMMFFLVVVTFRSFSQALIVFAIVPLGFIGVAWGHFLHGMPISIFSFLGLVALIGVMINDSLVLVSAMNNKLKEGATFMDAVYEAGISRFRPILLTSVTTIAGLAPLILEKSFQAQFLVPMAISLAYGLLIATFTTLITLPVALVILNRLKVYLIWLWEGERPKYEEVEPAVKELEAEHE